MNWAGVLLGFNPVNGFHLFERFIRKFLIPELLGFNPVNGFHLFERLDYQGEKENWQQVSIP